MKFGTHLKYREELFAIEFGPYWTFKGSVEAHFPSKLYNSLSRYRWTDLGSDSLKNSPKALEENVKL
jgi:hypothetical protein